MIFKLFFTYCFFSVLTIFLYFRYKGKLTPEEIYRKQNEKRLYVLSKITTIKQYSK